MFSKQVNISKFAIQYPKMSKIPQLTLITSFLGDVVLIDGGSGTISKCIEEQKARESAAFFVSKRRGLISSLKMRSRSNNNM